MDAAYLVDNKNVEICHELKISIAKKLREMCFPNKKNNIKIPQNFNGGIRLSIKLERLFCWLKENCGKSLCPIFELQMLGSDIFCARHI